MVLKLRAPSGDELGALHALWRPGACCPTVWRAVGNCLPGKEAHPTEPASLAPPRSTPTPVRSRLQNHGAPGTAEVISWKKRNTLGDEANMGTSVLIQRLALFTGCRCCKINDVFFFF